MLLRKADVTFDEISILSIRATGKLPLAPMASCNVVP